jgi:hypothetical protein
MKKRMAVMVNRHAPTSNHYLSIIAFRRAERRPRRLSALAGLEARVLLVDDVDTALAANKAVLAMTSLERLERILDLHFSDPRISGRLEFAGFPQSKTRHFGRAFGLAGM